MKTISKEGLDLIKIFEGFSEVPYVCSGGHETIGYGHVIKPGELFTCISIEQGERLLRSDVRLAEQAVSRLITAPINSAQFDALVSFTYNLGAGALQRSTLRSKVNRSEHHEVEREFMRWVWAGGRKSRGLIRRRRKEALLYNSMDQRRRKNGRRKNA